MMPDREKVIKGLEACAGTNTDGTADCVLECPYKSSFCCIDRLMYDALDLLKEQQKTISSFQSTILKLNAALGEQPEIVRCGECAHGHLVGSGFCACDKYVNAHYHDWYCADGEKR